MSLRNFKTMRPNTLFSIGRVAWTRGVRCSHRARPVKLVLLAVFCIVTPAAAQYTGVTGSVPSGPASNDVLRLTLRAAVTMAPRHNLGAIESGENAQIARGQRLIALSNLLPQVSAGVSENVAQTSLATLGIKKLAGIPSVLGPYSYGTVDASLSQTLFSFESIQRFRAARTAEQAAQLRHKDRLDVVTLTVGNAYLQVIESSSRIEAQQAQVRNAHTLYDQAVDEYQVGTSPRIEVTRTEVQLHTEEYNLSVARNNFAIAKLTLAARAIGLPLGQAFDVADQHPYADDAQVDGHIMPLSARINGYVLEVPVMEGQLVHAGDVLMTIDPQDCKIAVNQAQAAFADALASATSSRFNAPITYVTTQSNLESAGTAVINAQAGLKAAEQNFESAKAALEQAEANSTRSDADLARYEKLVAKEDISRQQYDAAIATATANRAAVASATAGVHSAEQAVRQAQGKLLQASDDLRSAQTAPQQVSLIRARSHAADAQVLQRHAQLAETELNLSYTIIRSPATGIVGKKSLEVGQNVRIGQELVEVVPLDGVWVTASFKETQLAQMRPGQAVEIKLDAYGRARKAHVTNVGNYVKVVQRVPVRIDFDRAAGQEFNADGLLKPGLSVEPDVRVR